MIRIATLGTVLAFVFGLSAGCASNPPPRPMPKPVTQRGQAQQPTQAETPERQTTGQLASQGASTPAAAREAPAQPAQPAESSEPEWYRQGAFDVEGREHRAFSVAAGDVREARSQAMQLAYQTYPNGEVAAHEAVRQADGSWRFYVLMAAGG